MVERNSESVIAKPEFGHGEPITDDVVRRIVTGGCGGVAAAHGGYFAKCRRGGVAVAV